MKIRLSPKNTLKTNFKVSLLYAVSFMGLATVLGIALFFYSNLGTPEIAYAAPTNISGVINSYLRVTSITLGSRQFVTDNLSGSISDFQVGKTIIIHQAKGATITTTNSAAYGTVSALNDAGNYEFAKVSSITGTGPYTITVTSLVNSYTASGGVQLVSVAKYVDATVTGNVIPIAWSSTQGRGGIIAMEVSGTLTLSANIVASGYGFAGGTNDGSNGDCPDASTYVSTSNNYAAKGEGIAVFTGGQIYARGAQASGGGGGNPHNAGGGGGSNFTVGGNGGQGYQPGGSCAVVNAGGVAGKAFTYTTSTTKLFFGGGGGSGQQNNALGSSGATGGGIIIVRANTVKSTCGATYGFMSNGNTANDSGGNDAAGGGGAGGLILLDVLNYVLTCNIQARANGGNGGTVTDGAAHGGGGAGGIGVIIEVNPTTMATKVYASTAGVNGKDCNAGSCTFSGTAPATPSISKLGIPGPLPGQVSVLPIELVYFTAEEEDGSVNLEWKTASELNNDYFTVERSLDGTNFTPFLTVKGAGTTKEAKLYSAVDGNIISKTTYYKLKQTDFDGKFAYSKIVYVDTESAFSPRVKIYPNPASDFLNVVNPGDGTMSVRIRNSRGLTVYEKQLEDPTLQIALADWIEGIYIVEVLYDGKKHIEKIVVNP